MNRWTQQASSVLRKEMLRFFQSPLLFAFWGVGVFLAGLYFSIGLGISPEPNLRIQSLNMCLTLLFILPLLSMRSFADEERSGTLEMLLSFPISLSALIAGKFIALWLISIAMIGLASTNFLVVVLLGTPDWGAFMGAILAQVLASSMYIAVGLFTSSLTREPIVAGLAGIVLLLPFWMIDLVAGGIQTLWLKTAMNDFSLVGHLQPMTKGLMDSVDVLWFGLMTGLFLWLTQLILESKRWR